MVLVTGNACVLFDGTCVIATLFYRIGAAVIAIIARSATKLVKTSIKKDKLLWAVFLVLAISTAVTARGIVWLFFAAGLLVMVIKNGFFAWKQRGDSAFLLAFGLGNSRAPISPFIFFLSAR